MSGPWYLYIVDLDKLQESSPHLSRHCQQRPKKTSTPHFVQIDTRHKVALQKSHQHTNNAWRYEWMYMYVSCLALNQQTTKGFHSGRTNKRLGTLRWSNTQKEPNRNRWMLCKFILFSVCCCGWMVSKAACRLREKEKETSLPWSSGSREAQRPWLMAKKPVLSLGLPLSLFLSVSLYHTQPNALSRYMHVYVLFYSTDPSSSPQALSPSFLSLSHVVPPRLSLLGPSLFYCFS